MAIAVAVGVACQVVFLLAWQTALAEHHAHRAQQALARDQLQAAAVRARAALALNPDQGYAAFFAGMVGERTGRTREAAEAFRRALATMAHRGRPLRALAACEEQLGDPSAAIDHLVEALAIEPLPGGDAASPRARLGRLLLGQGRRAEGVAQFRTLVVDTPESRFLFDGLAVGYESLGAPDMAVASVGALLQSERHVSTACKHLERLCGHGSLRPLILALLRATAARYEPGSTQRIAIDRLLKDLASE